MPDILGNPKQQQAIMHTAGAAQILAGPGSGKTFVTIHRIKHLITHHKAAPDQILVITFTRAAALEMQERFLQLMGTARPPIWFGTFHAVFYHILRQSARYRGYQIITDVEKKKLTRKIIQMHRRFADVHEEDYDTLLAAVSRMKNRDTFQGKPMCSVQTSPPLANMSVEDFNFFAAEYRNYLTEFRQMDFDDIVLLCEKLLTEEPGELHKWQRQFSYILIDEFQDISPGQYRVIKLLAAPENNLFVVGDDDQSIYRFRGADPASMRQFMKDYPDARQILLDVNYRCHKQIAASSLTMIGENTDRFPKEITASHEKGEGVQCRVFASEEEEGEYLIQKLREQQEAGTLSGSAVILRTNFECGMTAQLLEQAKIPYILKEMPKSRFSHFVIQDLCAYLKLAAGSMERRVFLRIMNRPVRYIRRESLTEERISKDKWLDYYREAPAVRREIERLFLAIDSMRGKKPYLAVRYVRGVAGYDAYLTERYGKEQGAALLQTAEEFQEFVRPFGSVKEVLDYISQYEEALKTQKEKVKTQAQKKENAVTLMTMHASKGLEFERVYLTGCEEGKIPSKKARTKEDVAEERRLFYVAMTRAKNDLYITAVKGKTGKEIPSRFLANCLAEH